MATTTSQTSRENRQAKLVMIFILVLSLSGLQNLIAEIIPELEIGPIEVGISTFWFVGLSLVIIFDNWWAALAVPVGELVFADLILGEFGGLGEFEEVILVTIALYVAAWLVRDVTKRNQLLLAGFLSYLIAEIPATIIDIFKVVVGVEEFEAVTGLPESIVVIEFIDFGVEFIISGIIFGVIPMLWLVPRLYGRIEPLMGLRPRTPEDRDANNESPTTLWIVGIIGFVVATAIASVSELGFNIVEWEPEFLDSIGAWFIWVGIAASVIVAVAVFFIARQNSDEEPPTEGTP